MTGNYCSFGRISMVRCWVCWRLNTGLFMKEMVDIGAKTDKGLYIV